MERKGDGAMLSQACDSLWWLQ